MTSTPTPPCLGEREAVARVFHEVISGFYEVRGWHLAPFEDQQGAWWRRADEVVSGPFAPLRTENETLRAERDAAIARAEEAERKVEDLSATIAAWEGAFGTIQSHLQDRIAMNDPARPDAYLRIVEGSVGELPRISRQIYAATQYRSQSTQAYANRVDLENETLTAKLAQAEGEIATMRTELERAGDALADASAALPLNAMDARIASGQALADLRHALTTPEPPHGD